MLKRTIIGALIVAPFFFNLVFAVTPNYTNISDKMVKTLSNDVVLTDSQKVIIQVKAKAYETKMLSSSQQTTDDVKQAIIKDAVLSYRAALDSILSDDQKENLKAKQLERMTNQVK